MGCYHLDAGNVFLCEFLADILKGVLIYRLNLTAGRPCCGAIAAGKYGFLLGEAALEWAGPGLREVCEATGMPPVPQL